MFALIACGAVWRFFSLGGLTAEQTRPVLTTVVYYLLLPALIIEVLWRADIGLHSFQYSALGICSSLFAMAAVWVCGRLLGFKDRQMGAVILATAFPNVTYMGLPVLEQTFGSWARSVAIQLDLFAATPFLLTAGVMAARRFGSDDTSSAASPLSLLNTPPFWAAITAVLLNLYGVPMPVWIEGILQRLGAGVVPLMLLSLGLALSWQSVSWRHLPYALPIVLIKMGLMPWFAMGFSRWLTLDHPHKTAAVLEMGMPCMVLGIVFCDRYRLDSSLYAMAVTVTTLLSLVTLPFWHRILTG
jgi:predicted permease